MYREPRFGVCYYPEHWPENLWVEDAAQMAKLGLSFVRIGEFAWSRLEPCEGHYNFDWLDLAIETLGKAGLRVILGTPTATPPRWMLNKFPDMLGVDRYGHSRGFGARRHYCFSHSGYREYGAKMAERLAERYAGNAHIEAWQIDNEYGCHDTVLSFSPQAQSAFQAWLQDKYGNIDQLNRSWGNIFWSMIYDDFAQIGLPNLTVTEPNPAHQLDFRRFSSDQVQKFNHAQCIAIRKYCNKPLIHNYMGRITDFDHFAIGADLDIASWDSYPLGFLEDRSERSEIFRHHFQRQGDPDFQAFHHDLYRGIGRGRWGVMEQQPGPVNWAPFNPAPLPGMVRLWGWEAIAHGAEFINYFRWRQLPFAQEQMHGALKLPDNRPAPVYEEIRQFILEVKALFSDRHEVFTGSAPIALIFDYESDWAWSIQPQGQDFNYFKLVYEFYCALRALGQNVDIIPACPEAVSDYQCLIIPGLFHISDALGAAIQSFKGPVLIGPRSGSKTPDFQIDMCAFEDRLGIDMRIDFVESLRSSEIITLPDIGHFKIWREHVHTNEKIEWVSEDGVPALISKNHIRYICGWPDTQALGVVLEKLLAGAGLSVMSLKDGLRVRHLAKLECVMNYTNTSQIWQGDRLDPADIRLTHIQNRMRIV